MLGSLFGSNRLHLEEERNQKIFEQVKNEVVLQNPSLDQLIWSIFRVMDANEGSQEEKEDVESREKEDQESGKRDERGKESLWDLEWVESGKKTKKNEFFGWRKERRNYVGIYFFQFAFILPILLLFLPYF